jgi:tetratricopeptide (TPR) repeat protein
VKLWDAQPWTPEEGAAEREALGLLDFLFARPLCRANVLDYLDHSLALRPEVRQRARALAERYREETGPDRYAQAAWDLARRPYLNAPLYRFALGQAQTACRLAPDQGEYATTLGAAQYRCRLYEEAVKTLTRADRLNRGSIADLAFLAMTQHQLGQTGVARHTLERLRARKRDQAETTDREVEDLLREAESLFRGEPGA